MPLFTRENARDNQRKSVESRKANGKLSRPKQVSLLQAKAFADAQADSTPVHIRASLMRAYHDLTRLDMDMKGEGKPRPVIARNDPEAKKARQTYQAPRVIDSRKVE